MLKIELHAHTRLDPADFILHSTRQLIDRAAALGYGALAVTLHDRYYDPAEDRAYAGAKGIVLIAGVERTIDRQHVILLNFTAECGTISSFDELRAMRGRQPLGIVIVPHAFYPIGSAMGANVDRCADLIDAVEVSSMFTTWVNFNGRAISWAHASGKPLVGATDLHLLGQLGTTYTLVDAAPDPDAICAAIRAGRVEVHAHPLPVTRAAWIFGLQVAFGAAGRMQRMWRTYSTRTAEESG